VFDTTSTLLWLVAFATSFALAGILYARRHRDDLENYVVARNSQGSFATVLTLLASSLGAWILFAPAQAATWGGIAAVTGYALGAMSPRIAMIPLGRRMRALIPEGHTLTEFLIVRYGRPMYALTLLIMLFYLFIVLSAEITAMARLITLIAPIPLWVTAAIVMGATLLYTSVGGLRSSIFTDKVQTLVILPLLLTLMVLGWRAAGGAEPVVASLRENAPHLIDPFSITGLKAGLTFFVAILLTGLFHQGNWQRVYSARNAKALTTGFLIGGLLAAPFIFMIGLFGLAWVAHQPGGDASVAVFAVLLPEAPTWFIIALIPLGLALVMSSADTAISAVSSIIAVDARRLMPDASPQKLMRYARWLILLLAIPVMIVASQGYSVLYLFLFADLLCSAAAFPVFYGLYDRKLDGRTALIATVAGLISGLTLFPAPDAPLTWLLESFLVAAFVPVLVMWALPRILKQRKEFDFTSLKTAVRRLDSPL